MTSKVETRLKALGLTLPTPATPVANYVTYTISGNLLIVSGQLPLGADGIKAEHKGKLGARASSEEASVAARQCAINLLAQAKAALGDLDKITRCLRLGGFIQAEPSYIDLAKVMNGASDLMVEVLGEAGRHARTTIGVASLPLDACVEVDAMFEFKA